MMRAKVCEHFISKFGNIPYGMQFTLSIDLNTINSITLEYLKHLKENQQCYTYSGLAVNIDDVLEQMKDKLLEMLKILGE
jgi:hypothetical protein